MVVRDFINNISNTGVEIKRDLLKTLYSSIKDKAIVFQRFLYLSLSLLLLIDCSANLQLRRNQSKDHFHLDNWSTRWIPNLKWNTRVDGFWGSLCMTVTEPKVCWFFVIRLISQFKFYHLSSLSFVTHFRCCAELRIPHSTCRAFLDPHSTRSMNNSTFRIRVPHIYRPIPHSKCRTFFAEL